VARFLAAIVPNVYQPNRLSRQPTAMKRRRLIIFGQAKNKQLEITASQLAERILLNFQLIKRIVYFRIIPFK
jgi:hypothetical protein